jgi:hypothetical protein
MASNYVAKGLLMGAAAAIAVARAIAAAVTAATIHIHRSPPFFGW